MHQPCRYSRTYMYYSHTSQQAAAIPGQNPHRLIKTCIHTYTHICTTASCRYSRPKPSSPHQNMHACKHTCTCTCITASCLYSRPRPLSPHQDEMACCKQIEVCTKTACHGYGHAYIHTRTHMQQIYVCTRTTFNALVMAMEHTYIHMCVRSSTHLTYTCIYTSIHACILECIHAHIQTCTHTHTHTCAYTQDAYIHTFTHSYRNLTLVPLP
jgi:hypothetical protein